jgi:hypothetical protein
MKVFSIALGVLALLSTMAAPVSSNVYVLDEPVQSQAGLQGSLVTGDMMAGMQVTFYFEVPSDSYWPDHLTGTWVTSPWYPSGGGGTLFLSCQLSLLGDSFQNAWKLRNWIIYPITGVRIDGFTGGVVFDVIAGLEGEGTPGSGQGKAEFPPEVDAFYYGATGILPDPPRGDLYRWLFIPCYLEKDEEITFFADTDRVVPLPSGVWLLISGLLGLGVFRKRLER